MRQLCPSTGPPARADADADPGWVVETTEMRGVQTTLPGRHDARLHGAAGAKERVYEIVSVPSVWGHFHSNVLSRTTPMLLPPRKVCGQPMDVLRADKERRDESVRVQWFVVEAQPPADVPQRPSRVHPLRSLQHRRSAQRKRLWQRRGYSARPPLRSNVQFG